MLSPGNPRVKGVNIFLGQLVYVYFFVSGSKVIKGSKGQISHLL